MTSSSDAVIRGGAATGATAMRLDNDLAVGRWTRLGGAGVRGDRGAESQLGDLADQVRAAARAEGYTAGWSEGHRTGLDKVMQGRAADQAQMAEQLSEQAGRTAAALQALDIAAGQMQQRAAADRAQIEQRLSAVVVDLVEAVIGAELRDGGARATAALTRALSAAPQEGSVTVRMNPGDHAMLIELGMSSPQERIVLVADAGVAPGDAEVLGQTTYVDASISAAIERVREVLAR